MISLLSAFVTLELVVVSAMILLILTLLILTVVQSTSRVEIIAHEETHLKDVLPNLRTLRSHYRRPLWLSASGLAHSLSTLIKTTPDLPYRRYPSLFCDSFRGEASPGNDLPKWSVPPSSPSLSAKLFDFYF